MKALMIRGIDDTTYAAVKKLSKQEHVSMNRLIVNLLKRSVGQVSSRQKNSNFDQFFGSWTKEEYKDFIENTKVFKKIDKELWA